MGIRSMFDVETMKVLDRQGADTYNLHQAF